VLWRETATAAHGRAIHLVRAAWLVIFAAAAWGVWHEAASSNGDSLAVAVALVPVALATLVAVAALGVTSITNERDRGTFDLLLVSDLTPAEIVWGKLLGILVVAREMVVLPVLAGLGLALAGLASVEQAGYLSVGMAVLVGFCAVLGVHVGLSYPVSRRAIGVTLATVVFLFVGVATAMRIMVAFSASFELQLAPFLAVMVGGGIGLYAALAVRVPSAAIGWAAAILPTLTFVAITSFLQGQPLQVFLVVLAAYGFSTAAMLVPAIGAFDAITGRVD
jgi:ABC-type Na+ efflux pump permease subunit